MALTKDAVANTDGNAALFETDDLKPATTMAASGALIEPTIVERVDTAHPAVDNNPRAGQSVASNRLDLNDPTIPGHVATARKLGMKEELDTEPAKAPALVDKPIT